MSRFTTWDYGTGGTYSSGPGIEGGLPPSTGGEFPLPDNGTDGGPDTRISVTGSGIGVEGEVGGVSLQLHLPWGESAKVQSEIEAERARIQLDRERAEAQAATAKSGILDGFGLSGETGGMLVVVVGVVLLFMFARGKR